jgi:hypothetical protein
MSNMFFTSIDLARVGKPILFSYDNVGVHALACLGTMAGSIRSAGTLKRELQHESYRVMKRKTKPKTDGAPRAAPDDSFIHQAEEPPPGLAKEFLHFFLQSKKWWLLPIVGVLLVFGLLVMLGNGPLAPLIHTIYALF